MNILKNTWLLFLSCVLLPLYAHGEIDAIDVMQGRASQEFKPQLGMIILSSSSQSTVLMSGNGRYIVSGSMTDLWDGMDETRKTNDTLKPIDPAIKESLPTLDFALGNPDGVSIKLFLTSNCKSCSEALEWLLKKETLQQYRINIMFLTNNAQNQNAAQFVYCHTDKIVALKMVKESPFKSFQIPAGCDATIPSLATAAAMAMQVKALPLTYLSETKESIFGDPTLYL